MSLRFRRSKSLGGLARINVSKTGVGLSVGPRGARISAHSSGRVTRTVGAPGTGAHYRKDSRIGANAGARRTATSPRTAAVRAARPGVFAPKADKALHRATSRTDIGALDTVAANHPTYRCLALTFAGALACDSDPAGAAARFAAAHQAPWTDEAVAYTARYLPQLRFSVSAGPGVDLEVPPDTLATIMVVTAAQEAGDHDRAADVAETLDADDLGYRTITVAALHNAGRHDRVLALTEGFTNSDAATMLMLVLRAAALRHQGLLDAAREVLREALKSRARDGELRQLALFERAKTYAAQGRVTQARKDLERILAENSTAPGVRELLATLA